MVGRLVLLRLVERCVVRRTAVRCVSSAAAPAPRPASDPQRRVTHFEMSRMQSLLVKSVLGTEYMSLADAVKARKNEFVVRRHKNKDIRFHLLEQKKVAHLCRLLESYPESLHSVVTENDPVDFFLDVERKLTSWAASEAVLKRLVPVVIEQLQRIDAIKHVVVLEAARTDASKQSFHIHVRLQNEAFRNRYDVRQVVSMIRSELPDAIKQWVDATPASTGSLRLYQCVTADGIAPLKLLDLSKVKDAALRKTLSDYQPASEEEVMLMALMRRDEGKVEMFERREREWAQGESAPIRISDPLFRLEQIITGLDYSRSDDYESWANVMRCCARIAASQDLDQEEVYQLFDDFSQKAPQKYNPRKNLKQWNSYLSRMRADKCDAIAWRTLYKMLHDDMPMRKDITYRTGPRTA